MLHDGQQRFELPKTVRESGAEAVAFTGRAATKLETGTAASDYVRLYRGDVNALTAVVTSTPSPHLLSASSARLPKSLTLSRLRTRWCNQRPPDRPPSNQPHCLTRSW